MKSIMALNNETVSNNKIHQTAVRHISLGKVDMAMDAYRKIAELHHQACLYYGAQIGYSVMVTVYNILRETYMLWYVAGEYDRLLPFVCYLLSAICAFCEEMCIRDREQALLTFFFKYVLFTREL